MALLGFYEDPTLRLARLRSALDSTSQSMGDTVNKAVDLEARRRAMEDSLRQFRQVERQQMAERRQQPTPSHVPPTALPRIGTPTATPTPTPRVPPAPQRELTRADLGLGTVPDVDFSPEAAQRRRDIESGVVPQIQGPLAQAGINVQNLERFQTQFADPIAVQGAQVVDVATFPGVLIGQGVREAEQALGGREAPELTGPPTLKRGVINAPAAILGDEEEIAKAQQILNEDMSLPASLAARLLFAPENAFPGIGLTKVDNFARLLKFATKATPKARVAAIQTLRESSLIQDAFRGVREAGEAGGRPPTPPLGGGPRDSLIEKLRVRGAESPEIFEETKRLVGEEFGVRSRRAVVLRDELIAQGVSPQEATLKATTELRGEMPFRAVTGLEMTPADEAFLWDSLIANTQYGEQANVATYFQTMQRQMAAGEKIKDFPPFIYRILGKGLGEDFVEQLQKVVKLRVKAVAEVVEETAAERLAKAKPPKGVTDKAPLPPEVPVGEQLQLQRGVPGAAPAPGPQRTVAEGQQFRAEIELEASPAPKGVSPGEVADPTGAEQGILRDAAEQFPAPGVDLQGVQVKQRETFLDLLSNTVGILKPLLSSMDISWFRQISKSIGRHPRTAFQSLRRGTTALWSQEKAVAWMDALRAEGSTTTGYRQLIRTEEGTREIALGKLLEDRYLAIPGTPGFGETPLTRRPEFFMSEAAQMVPGIRQSGRGFAVGWNTNYQGTARYWLDKLTKMNKGALTQKQVDAALNLQERITGVGRLGSDNSWFVKALKVLGFAPGFRVSGPEAYMTLLSPRTDPLIRRQAAEQLLSWAAMGNGILTALKYGAGATVVTELGASQFGRIKFPGSDTYYNIWGTDNVLARAVLQAIMQQRVDVKGNISIVGSGEKTPAGFASSFTDSALSYLKSGEAPAIGLFEELRTGETFIGKKLRWDTSSVWEVLKNRLPIVMQDFMDLLQTEGPLQTIFSVPGGVTGTTGITSYTPTRETFRAIPKYNSSDQELVESVLGRKLPEPLNLTANEERTLLRFLRVDVREWVEDLEDKHGPIPSRVSMEEIILKVAQEKGLSSRDKVAAVFLHKAKSNNDALNKEWVKFLLKNRPALEDFYPTTYDTDVIQAAQQKAEELGLVPVR